MPTIATTEAFIVDGVATTALEQRLYDTAMFLGDGSANGIRGGIAYHGPSSLAVSVNGSDQVTVQAGACVIPAGTGLGVWRGTLAAATSAVGLTARNSTNPRIDLIVAQATGTNLTIKTIDGTPAASPVAPALPAQHIELARVTVPQVAGGAVTVDSSWRTFAAALGGTVIAESKARLPGSGSQKSQRAIVLDTGATYAWSGTAWVMVTGPAVALTLSAGSGTASVSAHDGLGCVDIDYTTTGAASGGVVATIPVDYRPTVSRHVSLFNNTTGGNHLIRIEAGGTFTPASVAMTAGHRFIGTLIYRL